MSEHTKEPWRYDYAPGYCGELIGADGTSVCAFTDEPSEVDARRIAACVNACIGIKTDYLETIVREGSSIDNEVKQRVSGKNAAERAARAAEQQRDELLAQLIEADAALVGMDKDGPTRKPIRAAIAKVKP